MRCDAIHPLLKDCNLWHDLLVVESNIVSRPTDSCQTECLVHLHRIQEQAGTLTLQSTHWQSIAQEGRLQYLREHSKSLHGQELAKIPQNKRYRFELLKTSRGLKQLNPPTTKTLRRVSMLSSYRVLAKKVLTLYGIHVACTLRLYTQTWL